MLEDGAGEAGLPSLGEPEDLEKGESGSAQLIYVQLQICSAWQEA